MASRSSRFRSESLPVIHVQYLGQRLSNPSFARSSSPLIRFTTPNFCSTCYGPSHFTLRCPLLANTHLVHLETICLASMQKLMASHKQRNTNKPPENQNIRFLGIGDQEFSSSGRQSCVSQMERKYRSARKSQENRVPQQELSIKQLAHHLCSMHH